jgi:3-hydroxyisobutyrate dehydrogenase-like beta-hydroxyacid dehydrogenase
MANKTQLGFIGLGKMGAALAQQAAGKDYPVVSIGL